MALKRKLEFETDDVAPNKLKQLKLVPFPNFATDDDIEMSEAGPLFPDIHHTRIPSDASSTSSNASYSPITDSSAYPTFDLYPLPFFNSEGSVNPNSHAYSHYAMAQSPLSARLLQPSTSFVHHGTGCSQIPKLRVACASGVNGQRTMWSFCEQCGAISMVDNEST